MASKLLIDHFRIFASKIKLEIIGNHPHIAHSVACVLILHYKSEGSFLIFCISGLIQKKEYKNICAEIFECTKNVRRQNVYPYKPKFFAHPRKSGACVCTVCFFYLTRSLPLKKTVLTERVTLLVRIYTGLTTPDSNTLTPVLQRSLCNALKFDSRENTSTCSLHICSKYTFTASHEEIHKDF